MTWPAPAEAAADPVAAFHADGAAALGRVLDAAQLATVRAAFDDVLEQGVTGGYARIVHDGWRKSPALAALVPALGAHACRAIGVPALVLFHDHLLMKYPHGEDMAWHQDFSYLPIDRPDGLTLWIALDDVGVVNGCLYYLLGTHRDGERRAAWGMMDDDDPRAGLPPPAARSRTTRTCGIARRPTTPTGRAGRGPCRSWCPRRAGRPATRRTRARPSSPATRARRSSPTCRASPHSVTAYAAAGGTRRCRPGRSERSERTTMTLGPRATGDARGLPSFIG